MRIRCILSLAFAIVSFHSLAGAESNPIRLAVGPFFPPVAAKSLHPTAELLPQLLSVELSNERRFALVERDKVQSVLTELNLNASGLTSKSGVAKLGNVLACDWVISGSLVQMEGKTLVWTKVIDVRSGVVRDLEVFPLVHDDVSVTVSNITRFLGNAGSRAKSSQKQFVSLGRIVDIRPWLSGSREDWSRRVSATIERQCLLDGFGVVEMEAMTPLFEERRLAAASGQTDEPVKLQPAFWLVDGGCKWIEEKPERIEIGLRVQRVGGKEQRISFTVAPGEAAEKMLVDKLRLALADTNRVAPQLVGKAESELMARRAEEMANLRLPFMVERRPESTSDPILKKLQAEFDRITSLEENARRTIATMERNLLLDPDNNEIKTKLGGALYLDSDPSRSARGQELLDQVIASKDPKWSPYATRQLNDLFFFMDKATAAAKQQQQVKDQYSLELAVQARPSDLEAKLRLGALLLENFHAPGRERAEVFLQEVIALGHEDIAERARGKLPSTPSLAIANRIRFDVGAKLISSESVQERARAVQLLSQVTNSSRADLAELARALLPAEGTKIEDHRPAPVELTDFAQYTIKEEASCPALTAVNGLPPFHLWGASGTNLFQFARNPGKRKFDAVEVKPPLQHTVNSISIRHKAVWLGTEGGGVIKVSTSGEVLETYGAAEGMPGLFIKNVVALSDRVWVGFALASDGDKGGFGYIDPAERRFVSLTTPELLTSGQETPNGPPAGAVTQMRNTIENVLWVRTPWSLKRYDVAENRWSQALTFSPKTYTVAETFVTASTPTGGVMVCQLPGTTWKAMPLSNRLERNSAGLLKADGLRAWVASEGRIRIFDFAAERVIGAGKFNGREVQWLYPTDQDIYFIAAGATKGTSTLYSFWRRANIILSAKE